MADHADIDHTGLTGVGGSVATDSIFDAAGDLVVGTGANTAAKLTKGSNGDVLTVVGGVLTWAAPAGGGGATIQHGSLKPGTPTDDFDGASLGGSWSAHSSGGSFGVGNCFTQAEDGSHLSMGFHNQSGQLYRPTTNVDQEWSAYGVRTTQLTTGRMIGIAVLDTSGNGVGVVSYTDGNSYLADIATWQYNGILGGGTFSGYGIDKDYSTPRSFWLGRVGNVWTGKLSLDGNTWVSASATGSKTIVAAHRVIGTMFAAAWFGRVFVDAVHEV